MVRFSAPPFLHPCYFGTDIDSTDNLIAAHHSVEEIGKIIGADSIGFLSLEACDKLAGGQPLQLLQGLLQRGISRGAAEGDAQAEI